MDSISGIVTRFLENIAESTTDAYHDEVLLDPNSLNKMVTDLEPLIAEAEQLTEDIHSIEVVHGCYADESGTRVADNENIADTLRLLVAALTEMEQSELYQEINDHERRQLHVTYQRVIALAHRGIAAMEALTGAFITHDLDAEPPPAHTWDSLDDMLAALKAQPA